MFSWLKRRKKKEQETLDSDDKRQNTIELCEQMIDASRELENIRDEYRMVSAYLNDIQLIQDLPEHENAKIIDVAQKLVSLNDRRNLLLKTRNRISDTQFAQMQSEENQIPAAIKRLESNEDYLSGIERNLKILAGEKLYLEEESREHRRAMKLLRCLSIGLSVLFAAAMAIAVVLNSVLKLPNILLPVSCAFLGAAGGALLLLQYQKRQRLLVQTELNLNHAIRLENRVKIKYVNIKNAVDYACEKYHVKNSRELLYVYEQYQEAVRERRQFREINDDLSYYNEKLVNTLREYRLHDAAVWTNYPGALCDSRDVVEVKHNLIVRRQKLRNRMEYNMINISKMKDEVRRNLPEGDSGRKQVESIIDKIEKINQNALNS